MVRIWIVRHGETAWSLSGQHTGRTDIGLTDRGREQARALKDHLAGQKFDHVLCSPLGRARETCALAGYQDVAQVNPDLLEWDYGIYEGRTTAEIRHESPRWSLWTDQIEGGESIADIQDRAARIVRRLEAEDGDILIFSHSHIMRSVIGVWMDNRAELGAHLNLATGSVSILGHHGGMRIVEMLNGFHVP